MFDKFKQLAELNKMRAQAVKIQKELKKEQIELNEEGIKVVVSGDQKIQVLEIDGMVNNKAVEVINKAIKKSQEVAAKKLQEMSGGLTGMMKGMMG
ncbi:MAG TPA: YbaB/EbfC family nucleoid-associated protein [Candidatus Bathyarchaeia archaeon]|nr:YbaB/EbfC family nucleoid-associated protein [Candidatus Bathyarchaeia archaeon]